MLSVVRIFTYTLIFITLEKQLTFGYSQWQHTRSTCMLNGARLVMCRTRPTSDGSVCGRCHHWGLRPPANLTSPLPSSLSMQIYNYKHNATVFIVYLQQHHCTSPHLFAEAPKRSTSSPLLPGMPGHNARSLSSMSITFSSNQQSPT